MTAQKARVDVLVGSGKILKFYRTTRRILQFKVGGSPVSPGSMKAIDGKPDGIDRETQRQAKNYKNYKIRAQHKLVAKLMQRLSKVYENQQPE